MNEKRLWVIFLGVIIGIFTAAGGDGGVSDTILFIGMIIAIITMWTGYYLTFRKDYENGRDKRNAVANYKRAKRKN